MEEEIRINNTFHNIVTSEDWSINKLDVAELYLNDQMQDLQEESQWSNMDGLTIIYVPGYGKLQMVWIEENYE